MNNYCNNEHILLILDAKLGAEKAQLVTKYQKDGELLEAASCHAGQPGRWTDGQIDRQMSQATTTPHRPNGREVKIL